MAVYRHYRAKLKLFLMLLAQTKKTKFSGPGILVYMRYVSSRFRARVNRPPHCPVVKTLKLVNYLFLDF
jgi:hypothetical protein